MFAAIGAIVARKEGGYPGSASKPKLIGLFIYFADNLLAALMRRPMRVKTV
jgi:hypothetical protein